MPEIEDGSSRATGWWQVVPRATPLTLTLVYLVAGVAWITVTDVIVAKAVVDPWVEDMVEVAKGWLYVVVTAAVLYSILRAQRRSELVNRSRMQLLLDQVPVALWTTDRELRIQSLVGSLLAYVRRPPDQLVGRPVYAPLDSAELREEVERSHRTALGGEAASYEVDFEGHDLVARVEPLRSPTGRITGCVGAAFDVTGLHAPEGRDLGEVLRRSRTLAALGALTMEISHQFKNPLFALTAALDAFEERVGDQPQTARHRALMREQVQRIRALVEGLQEYGRAQTVNPEREDLRRLVTAARSRWLKRAGDADVDLEAVVTDSPAWADVDAQRLGGALDEILENAVRNTPSGGRIELSLELDDHEDPRYEVSVTDSGPGFRDRDLDRVLEPLFTRDAGTGLGLALADRVVQLHGGRLAVGNAEGGGARVVLVLPAAPSVDD